MNSLISDTVCKITLFIYFNTLRAQWNQKAFKFYMFSRVCSCVLCQNLRKSERFSILMMKSWKSNMQAEHGSVRALFFNQFEGISSQLKTKLKTTKCCYSINHCCENLGGDDFFWFSNCSFVIWLKLKIRGWL